MSNMSVSSAKPLSQVVTPLRNDTNPAAPSGKSLVSANSLDTADSLRATAKKGMNLPSIAAGVAAGAAVVSAGNVLSLVSDLQSSAFADYYFRNGQLTSLGIEATLSRAAWGAGVGAVVGAIVATQTDDKKAALIAGAIAGGVAGVLIDRRPDLIVRYAALGAAGGFAASLASQALRK